jgi:hypothetical protein
VRNVSASSRPFSETDSARGADAHLPTSRHHRGGQRWTSGLDKRTRGRKTAASQLFSPFQHRALGFATTFGCLANVEHAYQLARAASKVPPGDEARIDYALFSSGQLVKGRAAAKLGVPRSANDETPSGKRCVSPSENNRKLPDWNNQLETALGITHEPGRALRGWLMDHAKGKDAERGSTRELVYLDAKGLIVLGHMTDIVEYARTSSRRQASCGSRTHSG